MSFTSAVPLADPNAISPGQSPGSILAWQDDPAGTPSPGQLQLSETRDVVCDQLTALKDKTHSPYRYMGLAMRICCYAHCCSTNGLGIKSEKTCCTIIKAKAVKWSSNCCAGLGLFLGSILSCGYLAVRECLGRKKDAEENTDAHGKARIHPV